MVDCAIVHYGFVIDQNACIGCHACTVACKAENDVPVGSFRTWVKYTERGKFPDVKRTFLVQRCNHCRDAPCVTICPVNALEKRPDGIVDVDRDACIGCRACMQACPYDALYLNDDLGAVEKCHFCAHRVDNGLEPACVTVCPVGAIIPGDLDDPESRVSLLAAGDGSRVRRPEQGTRPSVVYVGADETALRPGAAARPPMYLWSDRPPHKPESVPAGPAAATVVLDVGHRVEWGKPIAIYLVTKGIAAGCAMLAPFAAALGLRGLEARWWPEAIAIAMSLLTLGLLVEDLARPALFYRLLTRPNWKSWLVRGGVLLGAFTATAAGAMALRAARLETAAEALRAVTGLLGVGVAAYTAMLFAQCRGRDLWESPMMAPHLVVQAVMCGGATLLALAPASGPLAAVTMIATAAHIALSVAERFRRHPTGNAAQAAAFLGTVRLGPFRAWRDGLLAGAAGALLALVVPEAAIIPVLAGLFLYEHAWVRAGQLPPLS
jgi:Fe-S-cluster-containing dehydrogenase component